MHIKVELTYLVLSISFILVKSKANKNTQRSQADEKDFNFTRTNIRTNNIRKDKLNDITPKMNIVSQIAKSNPTVGPKPELNYRNGLDNDSKYQDDIRIGESRPRRRRRYHKNSDDSDVFDDIENDFSFDEMSSDVSGYDSYHGNRKKHKNKKKRRRGPPRYPPLDRDTLYEVGLLVYLRDFHIGMII